jgi:hypothetical protein
MDRSSLRAYLDRPWEKLEANTERHRVETYRRDPAWAWRTAAALRAAVSEANPDWPTTEGRAADYNHHVRLRRLLDRASHAITRRRRAS